MTLVQATNLLDKLLINTSASNPPQVTILADKVDLKVGQTATVYFKLSQASSDFTLTDITVTGGTLATLVHDDTNPLLYSATFTPDAVNDLSAKAAFASISVAGSAFTNTATVANVASAVLSFKGDTVAPALPVIATADLGNDATPLVSGTAEVGSTVTAVIAGATYTTTASAGGVWSVDTTPTTGTAVASGTLAINANGTNSISVTATDAAGNISAAATQTLTVDTTVPTVSIGDDEASTGIIAGGNITYTFSFAEPVTGFDASDITVANGSKGTFTPVSATVYTLVVTPDSNFTGNVTVDVPSNAAQDAAGNNSTAAEQSVQAVDTAAPTVTNASALDGITNLDVTSNIVLNFGTAVSYIEGGHISLVNDANTTGKAGYQGEARVHTIDLYLGSATTVYGVTEIHAYQDSANSILSGTVKIDNVTGRVTINPLYDLDLTNNYHLEIAVNTFTKTSNGLSNAAFGAYSGGEYAMNFSTVSPGAATSSGGLAAAGSSYTMSTDGATLVSGHKWVSVSVSGLGSVTAYTEINVDAENYALVMKNASSLKGELGLGVNVYFALRNFGKGDMVYFDDQNNAAPIFFDSNADAQPNGYSSADEGIVSCLAYDLTTPSTARGYTASIAFIGVSNEASIAALAGQVIVG